MESCGVFSRRTPYRTSFPFFPGKERKLTGEASSAEESEGLGIFPDAASSGGLHRLAMLATAFLASEKIPMSPSDNGRRGLTLQEKETAARAKFAATQGRRRSAFEQLAVSNEQLAVGRAFSCLAFEAFVILVV